MLQFQLDPMIAQSSVAIISWPLSELRLQNQADYPWCVLIPRVVDIQELYQLTAEAQQQLMQEIIQLSRVMQHVFQPDKLNVATLGNRVSQLHCHVVARYRHDALWPHAVWQAACEKSPYTDADRLHWQTQLQMHCADCFC